MSAPPEPRSAELVGRTIITGRALHQLARGIVRDALGVAASEVSVELSDRDGSLRAELTVPARVDGDRPGALTRTAAELRQTLIELMAARSGRGVGSVEVRFSGVRRVRERRVG